MCLRETLKELEENTNKAYYLMMVEEESLPFYEIHRKELELRCEKEEICSSGFKIVSRIFTHFSNNLIKHATHDGSVIRLRMVRKEIESLRYADFVVQYFKV